MKEQNLDREKIKYQGKILEEIIFVIRKIKKDPSNNIEQDANFIKEKAMELLKTLEKKSIE